jgi:hypothetical protein
VDQAASGYGFRGQGVVDLGLFYIFDKFFFSQLIGSI